LSCPPTLPTPVGGRGQGKRVCTTRQECLPLDPRRPCVQAHAPREAPATPEPKGAATQRPRDHMHTAIQRDHTHTHTHTHTHQTCPPLLHSRCTQQYRRQLHAPTTPDHFAITCGSHAQSIGAERYKAAALITAACCHTGHTQIALFASPPLSCPPSQRTRCGTMHDSCHSPPTKSHCCSCRLDMCLQPPHRPPASPRPGR
jgi:hypothetical protein